jgi:5-methylcytosine-specific restriction endonuclease McrA
MTSLKRFNRKDRERILDANDHRCHNCKGRIGIGQAWEVEHVIAWALTRDDSDKNLRPAHVKCHRVKTHRQDRPAINKAERMRAKHRGCWPKPIGNAHLQSRPMRATRPFHHMEKR